MAPLVATGCQLAQETTPALITRQQLSLPEMFKKSMIWKIPMQLIKSITSRNGHPFTRKRDL